MYGDDNTCYAAVEEHTGTIQLYHLKGYGRYWACEFHREYLKKHDYTIGIISDDEATAGSN